MALESEPTDEGVAPNTLDDRDGPARRLASSELDAAVQAAVHCALPARGRIFRKGLAVPLIAATLCFAGVSAAFFGALLTDGDPPLPPQEPTRSVPPVEQPKAPEPKAPEAELPTDPFFSVPVEVIPEPAEPAESPEEDVPVRGPADLLKIANDLRGRRQWAGAERVYSFVASRYGATAQGPVAALAAASLRLEHLGDPKGALDLYKKARRASSLAAEAELGVANSYRALGDRDGEIKALKRLASAYPNAAFHEDVQRRLRALEAKAP